MTHKYFALGLLTFCVFSYGDYYQKLCVTYRFPFSVHSMALASRDKATLGHITKDLTLDS